MDSLWDSLSRILNAHLGHLVSRYRDQLSSGLSVAEGRLQSGDYQEPGCSRNARDQPGLQSRGARRAAEAGTSRSSSDVTACLRLPAFEVIRADSRISGGGPDGLRTKFEWAGCAPTGSAQRQTALGILRLPGLLGGIFTLSEHAWTLVSCPIFGSYPVSAFYLVVIKWWSSGGGVVA